jgi:predicted ATP-dependent endonuclease of OLD family
MYLSKFHIEGYRSIKELVLNFNKGLNIIIGENNSGKTAIIDAIRLILIKIETSILMLKRKTRMLKKFILI